MHGGFKRFCGALAAAAVLAAFYTQAQAGVDKINVNTGLGQTGRQFHTPSGLSVAGDSGLLVAEAGGNSVILIAKSGAQAFAGTPGKPAGYVDGKASGALFNNPLALAFAKDGTLYVCDTDNSLIRSVRGGYVGTVSGNGKAGYAEGAGIAASFNKPSGIAVSNDGVIYIADTLNHCIRKMDKAGNVSLFAGTPKSHGNTDGTALSAKFYEPSGIAFGSDGALYIADSANHSIRKIKNGAVSTIAGERGALNTETGYYAGGFRNGANPLFNFPKSVAVAEDGTIYVADTYNHAIRKLQQDGTAITIIGNGEPGKLYSNYKNAKLSRPFGIALAGQTLYVSDSLNDTVLQIPLNSKPFTALPTQEELLKQTGVSGFLPELSVCLNNKMLTFKTKPVKTHDSFTIPLSEFFTALGASAEFSADSSSVKIQKGTFEATLKSGEHYSMENGVPMLDVNALITVFPYIVQWYPEYNVLVVKE